MTKDLQKLEQEYLKKLIGRVYKIIPLKEEDSKYVDVYIKGLVEELISNARLMRAFNYDSRIMIVSSTLKSMIYCNNHSEYKSAVFKCIKYIEQLIDIVRGDVNEERLGEIW